MNANKTITISYKLLRATMLLFWIYVGIDKIWQLDAFKLALTQQPVISPLAPILYWLLPIAEIGLGIMLAIPSQKIQSMGWKASTLLISVFTVYIGLGVLGLYPNKPCMCSNFLSNVSWTAHLLINSVILALSLLGWVFNKSSMKHMHKTGLSGKTSIALLLIGFLAIAIGTHTYQSRSRTKAKSIWYQVDTLNYQNHNTVTSPLKGLVASTYDRYLEPYRQLFTKGLQAGTITNQLLVCNTERRIAVC